jgi:hypothetical protein
MQLHEMEEQIKNLNERATAIEEFLPTLATKQDLRDEVAMLATKENLRDEVAKLATKENLRDEVAKLATKENLRDELARLATKEDVADARRYALMLNEATRDDIRLLAEHMVAMQAQAVAMKGQLDRIEGRLP